MVSAKLAKALILSIYNVPLDLFRTSHQDQNISLTSSYLDLSPLYGSSQEEQNSVRTFKDGKMKPDCFSEKRLLGFPPGVGCILIVCNSYPLEEAK
jgi:hypothetical protein